MDVKNLLSKLEFTDKDGVYLPDMVTLIKKLRAMEAFPEDKWIFIEHLDNMLGVPFVVSQFEGDDAIFRYNLVTHTESGNTRIEVLFHKDPIWIGHNGCQKYASVNEFLRRGGRLHLL